MVAKGGRSAIEEALSDAAVTRRRLTTSEYERMGRAGVLHEDDRVELIEGELIRMAAVGSDHAARVKWLNVTFSSRLGARALVSVQDPIRLSSYSEPGPAIALLRPRADLYVGGHAGPADVLLIVEVSDTTLRYDRTVKVPLYAAAGIAEVWLIALGTRRRLLVHRAPSNGAYLDVQQLGRDARIAPLAFPDLDLAVAEILSGRSPLSAVEPLRMER